MERYFGREDGLKVAVHSLLAYFFSSSGEQAVGHARLCEELPFQLLQSEQLEALKSVRWWRGSERERAGRGVGTPSQLFHLMR